MAVMCATGVTDLQLLEQGIKTQRSAWTPDLKKRNNKNVATLQSIFLSQTSRPLFKTTDHKSTYVNQACWYHCMTPTAEHA